MSDIKTENIEKEDIYKLILDIWDNHVPFHKVINQKVIKLDTDSCEIGLTKTQDLVIDNVTKRLHGGVIASILDNTGALLAIINFIEYFESKDRNYIIKQSEKAGTLDLNIQYLRPGIGEKFLCIGSVVRRSKRLVVAKMELKNQTGNMVAMATGKYMIKD